MILALVCLNPAMLWIITECQKNTNSEGFKSPYTVLALLLTLFGNNCSCIVTTHFQNNTKIIKEKPTCDKRKKSNS